MIGRGLGIIISTYFKPKTMILYSLIGTTIGLVITLFYDKKYTC